MASRLGWSARRRLRPRRSRCETPAGVCSYAELLERARAGAGELAARGAGPGERVAIALPAGLDFVCALHACLLLGAAAVPVDLRLGERERAAIVDGAAVVVDEPLRAAARARAFPAGATHDLDAVAAVIHTSGTTSAPKPVELTYGNFLWSALGSAVALGLDPHERWLCNLPLSHVGGLSILLRSAIYATTAVVHERFDTELTLRAVMGPPEDTRDSGLAGRNHAHPPARRRPGAPARAALCAHRRRAGAGGAAGAGARGGGAGEPHLRHDRGLLAGDHAAAGRRAFGAPVGQRRREWLGGARHGRPAAVLHARAHRPRRGDRSRRADRRARASPARMGGCEREMWVD